MVGLRVSGLLVAVALLASACDQGSSDMPAAPELAPQAGSCNFSTVSQLVKNEFGASSAESGLATDMKNAGNQTDLGTLKGYQILTSIAGKYEDLEPANTDASVLAVALLGCMKIGTASIPPAAKFDSALHATGAFEVRGLIAPDRRLVASHDDAWVLEPPAGSCWQATVGGDCTATSAAGGFGASNDPRIRYAVLAYGNGQVDPDFTNDTPLTDVFDWSTIPVPAPSGEFSAPGVVVGECTLDSASYLQHLPANNDSVEVLGYVNPACPPSTIVRRQSSGARNLADRLLQIFTPEPAYATALLTTGTGGSKRTLSPFEVILPGKVVLDALFTWNTGSGYKVNVPLKPTPAYQIASKAGTEFKQAKVLIWLSASNNKGANVDVCNNYAYTGKDGIATFSTSFINKSGGYTVTTRSAGAVEATNVVNIPSVPPSTPVNSPLINVKSGVGTVACNATNTFTNPVFVNGVLTNPPPYPGPNVPLNP